MLPASFSSFSPDPSNPLGTQTQFENPDAIEQLKLQYVVY